MSKNMRVRIVPMTAVHLDAVAALERICFSDPWSRNLLAAELDNDLSAFLVALAAIVVVSLLTPAPEAEVVKAFEEYDK